MCPDDLSSFHRFRALYGAGEIAPVKPPTTPARRPNQTNADQTWTERQVLRLARIAVEEREENNDAFC